MLWLMVKPVLGKAGAFAVLGFVSLATVVGFLLSESVLGLEADGFMPVVQALIVGMIGHSLIHRSHSEKLRH